MSTTFIGYRRDDAAGYAGRLHEALERRLGEGLVFRDVDTLEPGQDFVEAIDDRLSECKVFLALIGREWLDARDGSGARRLDQTNDYVRLELASALARPEVRVIPVLIEGAVMPAPEQLPESVRALARRHAVSIRDDAWDHDVDRLAAVIGELTARPLAASRPGAALTGGNDSSRRMRWPAIGAVAFALAVASWLVGRDADQAGPSTSSPVADRPADEAGPAMESRDASPASGAVGDAGRRYGVPLPPVSEVVHPSLIYTLLSASMTPLDDDSRELRLRFRFSNEGPYDANAWDASFRLASGGQMLAPTSGLNLVVPGHSLLQGVVTFRVSSGARRVMVQVTQGDRVGELPLDLSPTGRPAEDENADAGDALSRAVIRPIVREPRELVRGEDVVATVVRVTSRRFANAIRLYLTVRLAVPGRFPVHSGALMLRLAAGDAVTAPVKSPSVVVEPASDVLSDFEFEVPPSTTRAVLRATARNAKGEMEIDLRQ
jgi:hypothetical protein